MGNVDAELLRLRDEFRSHGERELPRLAVQAKLALVPVLEGERGNAVVDLRLVAKVLRVLLELKYKVAEEKPQEQSWQARMADLVGIMNRELQRRVTEQLRRLSNNLSLHAREIGLYSNYLSREHQESITNFHTVLQVTFNAKSPTILIPLSYSATSRQFRYLMLQMPEVRHSYFDETKAEMTKLVETLEIVQHVLPGSIYESLLSPVSTDPVKQEVLNEAYAIVLSLRPEIFKISSALSPCVRPSVSDPLVGKTLRQACGAGDSDFLARESQLLLSKVGVLVVDPSISALTVAAVHARGQSHPQTKRLLSGLVEELSCVAAQWETTYKREAIELMQTLAAERSVTETDAMKIREFVLEGDRAITTAVATLDYQSRISKDDADVCEEVRNPLANRLCSFYMHARIFSASLVVLKIMEPATRIQTRLKEVLPVWRFLASATTRTRSTC